MSQTSQNIGAKINELISERAGQHGDLRTAIRAEVQRLAESGAVDLSEAENNFRIPMILLKVALENVAQTYAPPTPADQDAIENLRHF